MLGGDAGTVPVTVVVAPAAKPAHHPSTQPPTHGGPPLHLGFTGAPIDVLTSAALVLAATGAALVALARRHTVNAQTGATT